MVFNFKKKLISGRHCSNYNKFISLVIHVIESPLFQGIGKLTKKKKGGTSEDKCANIKKVQESIKHFYEKYPLRNQESPKELSTS